MKYKIQKASKKEFRDIAMLFHKIDYEHYPPPLSRRWAVAAGIKKRFTSNLTDQERFKAVYFRTPFLGKKGKWFVVKHNSKVVGAAVALVETRKAEAIGVDPDYRRLGIGYDVFKAVIDYLFGLDDSPITTAAWSRNKKSLPLFKKLGFKEVQRKKAKLGGVGRISAVFELTKEDYKNSS